MTDEPFDLAAELEAGLREATAHRRGEIELLSRRAPGLSAQRVREIRTRVSTSTREFQRRFHISARTVEGWESGKRVDGPSSVLLRVIEHDPEAVERALAAVPAR